MEIGLEPLKCEDNAQVEVISIAYSGSIVNAFADLHVEFQNSDKLREDRSMSNIIEKCNYILIRMRNPFIA
jgi:hypothetical protein